MIAKKQAANNLISILPWRQPLRYTMDNGEKSGKGTVMSKLRGIIALLLMFFVFTACASENNSESGENIEMNQNDGEEAMKTGGENDGSEENKEDRDGEGDDETAQTGQNEDANTEGLFMNYFAEALLSASPRAELEEKMSLFGRFVGEWDLDWSWMGGEIIKGEWIFSWVLDGTAIQDIWIVPSREVRENYPKSNWNYGTTMRFYQPQRDEWDVVYGCLGDDTVLLKPVIIEDDGITLEAQNVKGARMRWVFSEVTDNSFVWRNTRSSDDGETWKVMGEMHATRRQTE